MDNDPNIVDKAKEEQFDKLIVEPLKKYTNSPRRIVTVVIDALDECDREEDAVAIIRLLPKAKVITTVCLRFFVTSRPELPIRVGFKKIGGEYDNLALHEISKPVIEHDITAFLKSELAKIREDYNESVESSRQLPPHWPGTEQTQRLIEMAVPLFIFAATVCRFIQDRRQSGPKNQLAKILEHQTSRSNLDATYLPILDQLLVGLSESERYEKAERFEQVVGSIVILASPLSTFSLARLLAVPLDNVEDELDLLHSVLSIPADQSMPVRLFHLSFRDFLVDPDKGKGKKEYPFWVDERKVHERLATRCLRLLSTPGTLKRDICNLRLPGTPRSKVSQQTIDTALPPEVQYACRYWVHHWKDSRCKIRDGDLVDDFLINHLLHWLEALSLLGRISESIDMMQDLLNLLDVGSSTSCYVIIYLLIYIIARKEQQGLGVYP